MGLQALMLYLLIFTIVLAHELIHSLTAIAHGVRVPKITLMLFGGVASIELLDDPLLELKVSIVGPLFNFMLAGIGFALIIGLNSNLLGFDSLVEGIMSGAYLMSETSVILSTLVWFNLLLGGFNILPAFPMDGGRVFRSVLALWIDYAEATRISTVVGNFILILIGVMGLFNIWIFTFWTTIISLFLMFASGNELKYVNFKRLVGDARLRDIAVEGLIYVNDSLTWRDFFQTVYRRGHSLYLVVDSGGVLKGVFNLADLESMDLNQRVSGAPMMQYSVLSGGLGVAGTLKSLLTERLILVTEDSRLIGYVTPEILASSAAYLSIAKRGF